jgi:hypothetical protein
LTPNCSATIAFTCCSTVLISDSPSMDMFFAASHGASGGRVF